MSHRLLRTLALVVAPLASIATPALADACRFDRPTDLAQGATTWLGACPKGRADGPGALRAMSRAGSFFFFGTMHDGQPQRGVVTLDISDTIVAWRFDGPRAVPPADRDATQVIYDTAAASAGAVSRSFAVQGNHASARYYAHWRDALKSALDRPE